MNDFLGKGWKFPISIDEDNKTIAVSSFEGSIRQSIWVILSTARGERIMIPEFGCGIHQLVFSVKNAGTEGRIISEVKQALLMWEPRIDVGNIDVLSDPANPSLLLIEIEYRVRSVNSRFNLVYPFYVE